MTQQAVTDLVDRFSQVLKPWGNIFEPLPRVLRTFNEIVNKAGAEMGVMNVSFERLAIYMATAESDAEFDKFLIKFHDIVISRNIFDELTQEIFNEHDVMVSSWEDTDAAEEYLADLEKDLVQISSPFQHDLGVLALRNLVLFN
jgi:hypothetical protein